MAVVLTSEQLDFMAKVASWKFDVDFKDLRDSVTYTGDGVDDLTSLIDRLNGPLVRQPLVLCDVGRLFSSWIQVTVDDVYALRQRYIEIHGTVNKPLEYYDTRSGSVVEVTGTVVGDGIASPNPEGNYGDFTDWGDGRGRTGPTTTPDQVTGL